MEIWGKENILNYHLKPNTVQPLSLLHSLCFRPSNGIPMLRDAKFSIFTDTRQFKRTEIIIFIRCNPMHTAIANAKEVDEWNIKRNENWNGSSIFMARSGNLLSVTWSQCSYSVHVVDRMCWHILRFTDGQWKTYAKISYSLMCTTDLAYIMLNVVTCSNHSHGIIMCEHLNRFHFNLIR